MLNLDKLPNEDWADVLPEGWAPLYRRFVITFNNLLADYDAQNLVNISYVKEKFGQLRIYYSFEKKDARLISQVNELIQEIAEESKHTCIVCGDLAEYSPHDWIMPYCRKCAIKANDMANQRHKTKFPFETTFRKID